MKQEKVVFIDWVSVCNPRKVINGRGEPINLRFISVHICTNIEGMLEIEDVGFYKVPFEYNTPEVAGTANDSLLILTEMSHLTPINSNKIKFLGEALELIFSKGIFYFKGELHRVINIPSLERVVFEGLVYTTIRDI